MPVQLNSGGPPMTVIDIIEPGRNGGIDIVAWWRALDGKPQILEIDSRCVQPVGGGCQPVGIDAVLDQHYPRDPVTGERSRMPRRPRPVVDFANVRKYKRPWWRLW